MLPSLSVVAFLSFLIFTSATTKSLDVAFISTKVSKH